jgi:fatty acid desaturase
MKIAVKNLLSREEIKALTQKSDLRGAWAMLQTWLLISSSFILLALFPNPVSFVLVVLMLGGQQLACAILAHDASHRTLFKTAWMNTVLTDWLCARPIWLDVERYRHHHMRHHAHTGTKNDPDMSLVDPFPTTPASLRRKLLRDIAGLSGLRRIVGLVLMDVGVLKYSVSSEVERLPRNARGVLGYVLTGLRNMTPMLLSNLVLAVILAACGALWVYSAWVVAYLTSFSVYMRIRSIAEHACLPGGEDVQNNTRTTAAGWLARLTVAPFHVNYHQEHHLMASVSFYQLPNLHALLMQRQPGVAVPSYREVLRLAGAR